MRIVVAHSYYRVAGGEDRYVDQQVDLLDSEHEVLIVGERNDQLAARPRTAGRMVYSLSGTRELRDKLRSFDPDVIHLHNPYPSFGPSVHLVGVGMNTPIAFTVHNLRLRCPNGLMFTEGSLCRRCEEGRYINALLHECFSSRKQAFAYASALWVHRFVLRIERNVDIFIAPSLFMRRRLIEWGVEQVRIAVVPNFTPGPIERQAEEGRGGLYVGRLSAEKGLEFLIDALVQSGDPPFVIAGDGPLREGLRSSIEESGLRNVRLLGRVPKDTVRPLMQAARFVVIPSLCEENAPLAALEALSVGRPLLVSGLGGLPELVEDGAGLLFEPGNVDDLSEKMTRFMEDLSLVKDAREEAIRKAREFSPSLHKSRLEAAYERAIRSKNARI